MFQMGVLIQFFPTHPVLGPRRIQRRAFEVEVLPSTYAQAWRESDIEIKGILAGAEQGRGLVKGSIGSSSRNEFRKS